MYTRAPQRTGCARTFALRHFRFLHSISRFDSEDHDRILLGLEYFSEFGRREARSDHFDLEVPSYAIFLLLLHNASPPSPLLDMGYWDSIIFNGNAPALQSYAGQFFKIPFFV